MRILVTGAGIVSSLGIGKERTAAALSRELSGIGPVKYLETEHRELPCGEVKCSNAALASLCGCPDGTSRTEMLGIIAAREAAEEAGLTEMDAFISGTTVGRMDKTEAHFPEYLAPGSDVPMHDCKSSTDAVADAVGRFGMVTTISTACSSAANAIIFGADLILSGQCARVLVGGAECLSRFHLNGFNSLMILDKEHCRPFDKDRAGLNLGEGAAYLVLESEDSAAKRGASPIALLEGWTNRCDAFHQTASSPSGEGAYLAMTEALALAGLSPSDIDYINAHGTGTPNNDASESTAMLRVFGTGLPPVSSTKAFTGHTTSASGSIEAVICILAIQRGLIPANLGWTSPFEGGITPVTKTLSGRLNHVLCNSFGFGGNDSSLIFSRP